MIRHQTFPKINCNPMTISQTNKCDKRLRCPEGLDDKLCVTKHTNSTLLSCFKPCLLGKCNLASTPSAVHVPLTLLAPLLVLQQLQFLLPLLLFQLLLHAVVLHLPLVFQQLLLMLQRQELLLLLREQKQQNLLQF